jgi:hypothetical protein
MHQYCLHLIFLRFTPTIISSKYDREKAQGGNFTMNDIIGRGYKLTNPYIERCLTYLFKYNIGVPSAYTFDSSHCKHNVSFAYKSRINIISNIYIEERRCLLLGSNFREINLPSIFVFITRRMCWKLVGMTSDMIICM